MVTNPETVVVIGVHRQLLIEMVEAKEHGSSEGFLRLFLVYLFKRKHSLESYLQRDVQNGRRPISNLFDTLNSYEEIDALFRKLADRIIDTSDMEL